MILKKQERYIVSGFLEDIGVKIYNKDKKLIGTIIDFGEKYCEVCGRHSCYIVQWDNGSSEKICTSEVKKINEHFEVL